MLQRSFKVNDNPFQIPPSSNRSSCLLSTLYFVCKDTLSIRAQISDYYSLIQSFICDQSYSMQFIKTHNVFYSNRLEKLLKILQNRQSYKVKFYNTFDLFIDSRTFSFFNCPNSDSNLNYKQIIFKKFVQNSLTNSKE